MKRSELNHSHRLISQDGGTIDYVSDSGELLASVNVPPGIQYAKPYLDLCPEGAEVQLSGGLVALKPRNRVGVQPYGAGATHSGANPDFQPTSARRLEIQMRTTLNKMMATDKRLSAREKALANIERVPAPAALQPDPEPVVESIVDPAPADPVKPVVK